MNARLKVIHLKSPQANQLLAIDMLFNEKKDVIFITKTGHRKSMVFHSILALKPDTTTLMIMRLLALKKDQKLAIKKIQVNNNPCILKDETMTKELVNKI